MKVQSYYNNQISLQQLATKSQNWPLLLASRQLLNKHSPASQDTLTQQEYDQVSKDLVNQRVVHLDVKRTRVTIFDQFLMEGTERCLTLFCKKNNLAYKQGINEIIAPFALLNKCGLETGWTWADTYQCFSVFFKKYLLNLYFDEEFNSLELLFHMIRVILKYHDPALSRYLEEYGPELYATAWFMTLFSNKLSIRMLYLFWEIYIFEDDEFFIFYFIAAMVLYNKYTLLQTKEADLPQTLTQLCFDDPQHLAGIFQLALLVRKATPRSLMLFCLQNKVLEKCGNYSNVRSIFDQMVKINLFLVFPRQIVHSLYRPPEECLTCFPDTCPSLQPCYFCKLSKPVSIHGFQSLIASSSSLKQMVELSNDIRAMPSPIHFCILDIRVEKKKVLVDSELIDINQPILKIQEQFLFNYLQRRGKVHFVFLFSEFRFENLQKCNPKELEFCMKFIQILYSSGFQYMSILQGGFLELEKEIRLEMAITLNGASGIIESNGSFMQSPKKTYTRLFNKHDELQVSQFIQTLSKEQLQHLSHHGTPHPLQVKVKPSLFFTLEKMSVLRSSFVLAGETILLSTQKFIILFKSCPLLRSIVQFLNNSKSLTEYFLSGLKDYSTVGSQGADKDGQKIVIQSIYLIRDLDKISTKQPNIMFLYIKPRNPYCPIYQQHLKKLCCPDVVPYLHSVRIEQLFQIYDQYYLKDTSPMLDRFQENTTISKRRLECEGVVGQCVDNIKGNYDENSRLYKQHRKEVYRRSRLNEN